MFKIIRKSQLDLMFSKKERLPFKAAFNMMIIEVLQADQLLAAGSSCALVRPRTPSCLFLLPKNQLIKF
jgi:hypothetical protein